jgi:hypothetical protein
VKAGPQLADRRVPAHLDRIGPQHVHRQDRVDMVKPDGS